MPVNSTRRQFIFNASMLSAGFFLTNNSFKPYGMAELDHVLLGTRSLEEGIAFIKDKIGVEALKGGKHPSIGTHNALISLGEKRYLEIIAPDPDAKLIPAFDFLKNMQIPHLFTWAAHTENIEELAAVIKKSGYGNSGIKAGSRQRTDGKLLKWRTISVETGIKDLVPFFIEWDKDTVHPSIDSPGGCKIKAYEILYSDPEKLKVIFSNLGLKIPVIKNETSSLNLILETPKGEVKI